MTDVDLMIVAVVMIAMEVVVGVVVLEDHQDDRLSAMNVVSVVISLGIAVTDVVAAEMT